MKTDKKYSYHYHYHHHHYQQQQQEVEAEGGSEGGRGGGEERISTRRQVERNRISEFMDFNLPLTT